MTDEEILSLAKFAYNEAKTKDFRGKMKPLEMWMVPFIIEFHSLIQTMERDECGKICYVEFHKPIEVLIKDISTYENGWIEGCKTCFEKIYARGQK